MVLCCSHKEKRRGRGFLMKRAGVRHHVYRLSFRVEQASLFFGVASPPLLSLLLAVVSVYGCRSHL